MKKRVARVGCVYGVRRVVRSRSESGGRFVSHGGSYKPHGQPYVPGVRRADPPAPKAASDEPADAGDSKIPITLLAPPNVPVAAPSVPSPELPTIRVVEPAPSTARIEAAEPAERDVVLFGGDPHAHRPRNPSPGTPMGPPANAPATEPKKKGVGALHESRWWFLFPFGAALCIVGLVLLHKGPPSMRTKDGVIVDVVSDDIDAATDVAVADPPVSEDVRRIAAAVEIKNLAPTAGGLSYPRSIPAASAAAPPAISASLEIAHPGAVPRTGICTGFETPATVAPAAHPPDEDFGTALADAAAGQIRDLVIYDDDYRTIKYPGGDVAPLYGVCSDVVVRAYRALGIDLQARVHEARVGSPDTSIAHRRTSTLRRYFTRMGASLPVTYFAEDYLPGDVVSYDRPQNSGAQDHIAIVSNIRGPSGRFMIVHNRGYGPQIEDALFVDAISGHYRFNGAAAAKGRSKSKNRSEARNARPKDGPKL